MRPVRQSDHRWPGVDRWGRRPTSPKFLLIFLVHVSFWILIHKYRWRETVSSHVTHIQRRPLFVFLHLQLTWSPKSITITWGRRESLIHRATSPRSPPRLPPLLQRLRRASQRTPVLPLPRTAAKPLRTLPKTPGRRIRKCLWLCKSRADSGLHTSSFRFKPLFCTNSWTFPYFLTSHREALNCVFSLIPLLNFSLSKYLFVNGMTDLLSPVDRGINNADPGIIMNVDNKGRVWILEAVYFCSGDVDGQDNSTLWTFSWRVQPKNYNFYGFFFLPLVENLI